MSFASAASSNLRQFPRGQERQPVSGRAAIVSHVERWFAAPPMTAGCRAVLVVLDIDLDDALPVGEAEEYERRNRLGRSVERALSAQLRPGDEVARIDAGRFAVLRAALESGSTAHAEAGHLAHRVEEALVGRVEGFGARVTAGGVTLVAGSPSPGSEVLGRVTGAMLAGKLMTDDRVVVVAAGR